MNNGDASPPVAVGRSINRSTRLALTIASGWLRTAISVSIGLFSTPVLLRLLGGERFGVIRAAEQWFAYLELLSFGLGSAVGVLVMRAATGETRGGVPAVARTGGWLLARQLRYGIPASVLLVVAFPFAVDMPADLRTEFAWAAPALVLMSCLGPVGVCRSVLEAGQQGYLVHIGLMAHGTISVGLGVAFAAVGGGLAGQFWALLLAATAMALLFAHFSGALTAAFWSGPPAKIEQSGIWHLQWPLLVAGIGNQFNLLSDNLLAGALFGVGEVSALALSQRLFPLAMVFAASLNGAGTWAALVDLRSQVGVEAFQRRLLEASKLNAGICLLVLAPVLGCNRRFVELWVGKGYYAGDLLTLATFSQYAVFNFFYLYASLIDCSGLTRRRVWFSTCGAILKVVLIAPFTYWFGLAGLPLATTVGYLCVDAWVCPVVLARANDLSPWKILPGLAWAVGVGSSWGGVCYLVGNRSVYLLPGWLGLISDAAALGVGAVFVGWFFLLSRTERAEYFARLYRWVNKKQ